MTAAMYWPLACLAAIAAVQVWHAALPLLDRCLAFVATLVGRGASWE